MRICITGSEGYIGTVLADYLIRQGHEVVGFDTGFYKTGWLTNSRGFHTPRTVDKDMRDITVSDLLGFDAVVALAELSNDPLGNLVGPLTHEINHHGQSHVARTAKKAGVPHFIYASSCSVYGVADGIVDEESPVNPQTAYAICKVATENVLKDLTDDDFSYTALRFATAFGVSPRQRLDIVIPNLCAIGYLSNRLEMTSDGSPWRPLVHIRDIAKTIEFMLTHPNDCRNETFNVGRNDNNRTVKEIASAVADIFQINELHFGEAGADNRSYRVNFDKLASLVDLEWSVEDGIRELKDTFDRVQLTDEDLSGSRYVRLNRIRELLDKGFVDEKLRWDR